MFLWWKWGMPTGTTKRGRVKRLLEVAQRKGQTIQYLLRKHKWLTKGSLYKSISFYRIRLKSESGKATYGSVKEAVYDAHQRGISLAHYSRNSPFSYSTLRSVAKRLGLHTVNAWKYSRENGIRRSKKWGMVDTRQKPWVFPNPK